MERRKEGEKREGKGDVKGGRKREKAERKKKDRKRQGVSAVTVLSQAQSQICPTEISSQTRAFSHLVLGQTQKGDTEFG